MTSPKTVSIVGYKDSGKTRVVEGLVRELTRRGYKCGTLKHTAEDVIFDTPGKDTARHRQAGSQATAILHNTATAIFIDKKLTIQEAVNKLGPLDFLVIEGFKTVETHARIIVPRQEEDIVSLSNGLEIAVVAIPESKYDPEVHSSSYSLAEMNVVADIVVEKAFQILPALDCKGCGYEDCKSMGEALLRNEISILDCVVLRGDLVLKVNGEEVALGQFVKGLVSNVLTGVVKSLKGGEEAKEIEIYYEVKGDE